MENENAAPAAADNAVAASPTESVADAFDSRSPAEIEATSRQQEESTVDTTVDEDVEEEDPEADAEEDTDDTTKSTTQTPAESDTTKQAPSQNEPSQMQTLFTEAKQLDIKLPTDEFGNLDVNALPDFVQQVMEAAGKKAEAVIERRVYMADELERVETAFPELAKDQARMARVQALRTADVVTGGDGDLMRVAKEYMDDISLASQNGKESAKQHIRRQKSARLETSSRTGAKGESARLRQLTQTAFGASSSRAQREDARIARIRLLRDNGTL